MNNKPPKGKTTFCVILALLGQLGLIISSCYVLIAVFYHRSFDQWMPLRVLLIFCASILLLLLAGRLAKDNQYPKVLLGSSPFYIAAFACLGLLKFLLSVYSHRVPRHLNPNEVYLFIIASVSVAFCFWHFHLERKKQFNEIDLFVPTNLETAAQRVLKPDSRPYVLLGVAYGLIGSIFAFAFFEIGGFAYAIGAIVVMFVIYALLCLFISSQKIIIATDYLAYKFFGKQAKAVYFKDITKSREHLLYEGRAFSHVLDIYTSDSKRPALRINPKPFKPMDVKWLLSLPEMKFP